MVGNELLSLVKETPQILLTIYGDLAQPSVKKLELLWKLFLNLVLLYYYP